MNELGREARALLDDAAYADAAPLAMRQRGRERLVGALAVGSITTSTIVAKGATTGGVAAANVGSAGALPTLVSAVVVGLASGLIALSPTSERALPTATAPVRAPALSTAMASKARAEIAVTPPYRPTLAPANSAITDAAETIVTVGSVEAPLPRRSVTNRLAPQPEEPNGILPDAPAPLDAIAAPPTSKTSIARETELLAEVQRALKGGRALAALATLDRYAEECPARMLDEEATAARIVAVCALGRSAEGLRLRENFVRRYPNSPLLSRVRGVCPMAASAAAADAKSQ